MKSPFSQKSSFLSSQNSKSNSNHAAYFEQRNIVKPLAFPDIPPNQIDRPLPITQSPFLNPKLNSLVSQNHSPNASFTSNRSVFKSKNTGTPDFEKLYLTEQNLCNTLQNELICLKEELEKITVQKEKQAVHFEDYIKHMEIENNQLRSTLKKNMSHENEKNSYMDSSTNTNSELNVFKTTDINENRNHLELANQIKQLQKDKYDLNKKNNCFRDELMELVHKINFLETKIQENDELKRKNLKINQDNVNVAEPYLQTSKLQENMNNLQENMNNLQVDLQLKNNIISNQLFEISSLKNRPVQIQEHFVQVEDARLKQHVETLNNQIEQMSNQINYWENKPVSTIEKVVYQVQPCQVCPQKNASITNLNYRLSKFPQTQDLNSKQSSLIFNPIQEKSTLSPVLTDRNTSSDNKLTISCLCNQKCQNCGSIPQTNITKIDPGNTKFQTEAIRVLQPDHSTMSNRSVIPISNNEVYSQRPLAPSFASDRPSFFSNHQTEVKCSTSSPFNNTPRESIIIRPKSPQIYRTTIAPSINSSGMRSNSSESVFFNRFAEQEHFKPSSTVTIIPPSNNHGYRNKENLFKQDQSGEFINVSDNYRTSTLEQNINKNRGTSAYLSTNAPVKMEENYVNSQVPNLVRFNEYSIYR